MAQFKTVRKGYDIYEVDSFINSLNKEIEAFREKEDHINKAIISAEMTASDIKEKAEAEYLSIVSKAKEEAGQIVEKARSDAEKMISRAENQITLIRRREKTRIEDVKIFVNERKEQLERFNEDYLQLAKKYFETPNSEEYNKLIENLENVSELADNFLSSVDK